MRGPSHPALQRHALDINKFRLLSTLFIYFVSIPSNADTIAFVRNPPLIDAS